MILKRSIKYITIVSTLIMLCVVVLPVPAYARPKTFNRNNVVRLESMDALLRINDMTFKGKLVSNKMTDAELDALIQETLDEMGMTDAEFDDLNRQIFERDMTSEIDAFCTVLGLGIGNSSDALEVLWRLHQGDNAGAYAHFKEILIHNLTLPGKMSKMYKDWENVLKWYQENARTSGRIRDFYRKLNNKIADKFKDRNWTLEFIGATAKKPFTFGKEQCTEYWTLNMVLIKNGTGQNYDAAGEYKGNYTIEIEYDLDNMVKQFVAEQDLWQQLYTTEYTTGHTRQVSDGVHSAERTLTGEASALINPYSTSTVTPYQFVDGKTVNVSDIGFSVSYTTPAGAMGWNLYYSADEDNILGLTSDYWCTVPEMGIPDQASFTNPWEAYGDIWKRGDNSGSSKWNLTLTLTPIGGARW